MWGDSENLGGVSCLGDAWLGGQSRLRLGHEQLERRLVLDGKIGENLAVQIDARSFHALVPPALEGGKSRIDAEDSGIRGPPLL